MTREQAKEELKSRLTEYVRDITEPSGGRNMYICPLCGSGTGKHRTGAFSVYDDGRKWRCFACENGGDIFALIGQVENIPDFKNQFERAAEIFGITLDNTRGEKNMTSKTPSKEESMVDYTEKFKQAQEWLTDDQHNQGLEYLKKRGISAETAKKYGIGFAPAWRHPKAPKAVQTTPRIIIPTSKSTYLARDIRQNLGESEKKFQKMNVGSIHLFNSDVLYTSETPVYIVEGAFDVLSVIEAGGNAVGLGSTSMVDKFLTLVSKKPPVQPLIVALDNDENGKGQEAAQKLVNGLMKLNIPHVRYNVSGQHKDANDALVADRAAFAAAVERGNDIENLQSETENTEKAEYLQNTAAAHLQEFIDGISASVNTPCVPTGFKFLDEFLDGGFYEGLYTWGAISSLGKTTLLMQIMDQIAAAGNDVLIFSLEMSRQQLIAKSISRGTAAKAIINGEKTALYCKTSRGITDGRRYDNYSDEEKNFIQQTIIDYGKFADKIVIVEGVGNIGTAEISETVRKHIKCRGKKPVVLIDYLQLLSPCPGYERSTDKQIIDKNILELKRISRDYKTPVLVVSSFNRDNYNTQANMKAFKESGAVEYSSDVLIGLQIKGVGDKNFNEAAEKSKSPRSVELVILKNREGIVGKGVLFDYFAKYNCFAEREKIG